MKKGIFILFIFWSLNLFAYKIEIVKNLTNGWQILNEDGEPFLIKGVCYSPIPPGSVVWSYSFSEESSPWLDDGELMEEMGVNTIRIYYTGKKPEDCKKFIRQMYRLFSIFTVFPLEVNITSIDFTSEELINELEEKITKKVEEYKDTSGILLYLLGNEIDYYFTDDKAYWATREMEGLTPFARAKERARLVFEVLDKIAGKIKEIDPYHPVGISLGTLNYIILADKICTNIDFIGLNQYVGKRFYTLWYYTRKLKKPVLITEFGYDAYDSKKEREDEDTQAEFLTSMWKDIIKHSYKNKRGVCLGGIIFEWNDEWWKYAYGDPSEHNIEGSWNNPAWKDFTGYKFNVQEEWFGLVKFVTNDGKYIKKPRKAFYEFKKLWVE